MVVVGRCCGGRMMLLWWCAWCCYEGVGVVVMAWVVL